MALSNEIGKWVSPLVRILYPFGSFRSVLCGPLRGTKFQVAPGMGLSYAFPITDPFSFSKFKGRVTSGMTVYDVGANCGQMALFFSKLVGTQGKVIAFEPYPVAFSALVNNISKNNAMNVMATSAAVSAKAGKALLEFNDARATQSKLVGVEPSYRNQDSQLVTVDVISLDEVARDIAPPDFIKIDVEGAAAGVLAGAEMLLNKYRPKIYIELHGPEEQRAVNDYLIKIGYRVENLAGKVIADATAKWESPLLCA